MIDGVKTEHCACCGTKFDEIDPDNRESEKEPGLCMFCASGYSSFDDLYA